MVHDRVGLDDADGKVAERVQQCDTLSQMAQIYGPAVRRIGGFLGGMAGIAGLTWIIRRWSRF